MCQTYPTGKPVVTAPLAWQGVRMRGDLDAIHSSRSFSRRGICAAIHSSVSIEAKKVIRASGIQELAAACANLAQITGVSHAAHGATVESTVRECKNA